MQAIAAILLNVIVLINEILVPLLFAVAFFVFIFGVFRFFIAGGADKEKREEGRKFISWGLIGFVLMFSLWGIVNLLINSLGFDTHTRPTLPLFGSAGGAYGSSSYGAQGMVYHDPNHTYTNDPNNIVQSGQRGCRILGMNIGSCPAKEDCGPNGICQNIDGT